MTAQDRALDQIAAAFVCAGRLASAAADDPLGKFARRQRLRRLAQFFIDQPQAFPWPKPGIAVMRPPRPDFVGVDAWIEQPHRRIEMRQITAVLGQLLLYLPHRSRQFSSLLAQCTNNMRCYHSRVLQQKYGGQW